MICEKDANATTGSRTQLIGGTGDDDKLCNSAVHRTSRRQYSAVRYCTILYCDGGRGVQKNPGKGVLYFPNLIFLTCVAKKDI
jgi:hypothetical protein